MNNKTKSIWTLFFLLTFQLIVIQVLFFYFQKSNAVFVLKSIKALLRDELTHSNPNKVARFINDYEQLGIMKCSRLHKISGKKHLYTDLRYRSQCNTSQLFLGGVQLTTILKSINGTIFELSFVSVNTKLFSFMLWLTRIISFFLTLIVGSLYLYKRRKEQRLHQIETQYAHELINMAKQVSHDIRSPLTALQVVTNDCTDLDEIERITIRTQILRIQDIANSLLLNHRDVKTDEVSGSKIMLISTILEEAVTEKRLEYRSNLNLSIEGDFQESYGVFAKIDPTDLKTILSNVINNSVDSFKNQQGRIDIILNNNADYLKIKVIDNGQGMPPKVIEKLGQTGFSHGKENNKKSGSGIGVANAMKMVRKDWGGEMSYSSVEGKGTVMTITLPKQDPPNWFMPDLKISKNTVVVCLDDDEGIHSIWRKRIKIGPRLISLSTPDQFKTWVLNKASRFESVLYLSDYELLGYDENGLDLIESLNLKNAILVTSHYAETKIMDRCLKLGVRLIPKMLAGSVPIEIQSKQIATEKASPRYNAVHLDDDRYLRRPWKKAAEKAGLQLLSVANESDLMKEIQKVDKSAKFYIDESLGDNHIPGHIVAKKLFDLGFKNLYLATGYGPDKFSDLKYLSGVVGKKPVF